MKRGEIWHVDLEPVKGRRQQGKRFILVVSPEAYNDAMGGLAFVVPIAVGGVHDRTKGFTLSLTGAGTRTSGVCLCGQLRAVDIRARGGRLVEQAPAFIVDEVLAKLAAIFE